MTKPTIVTRAGKGSALTWTEGDANLTNLQNATISLKADTGGTDVVSDLNGTVTLVAGTNVTISGDNTAKTLTINAAGGSGISNVVEDLTPQLGGALDVNGKDITSASNGNINIAPNGSGNIALVPTTGKIVMGAVDWPTATPANNSFLVGQSAGTSAWTNTVKGYNEGALYDLGTTGGTIAPNVANGNVQKITLNSALTLNAFTSPVAGQSLTLIIYGGTSYTSITSTMKFAGGVKTLTATAGCIDIVSIYYDGTNYFASLGKGFA